MSALYAAVQAQMLAGAFNWATGTYAVVLVDDTYTPNFTTDAAYSAVPTGSIMSDIASLPGPTVVGGVAFAPNVPVMGVDTSRVIAAILLLNYNSANIPGSVLVAYINEGAGIGIQPLASTLELTWDTRGVFAP